MHQPNVHRTSIASTVLLGLALLLSACGSGGPTPTAADVEKVMHANWDKQASSTSPRSAVSINSVKFGASSTANAQDVIDGIPEGAHVTAALIDFSVRNYYNDTTQVVRRTREAKVYKDAFGEWAVMSGSVRGQDTTSNEAAVK